MSFLWKMKQKYKKINHSKNYASSPIQNDLRKVYPSTFIEKTFSPASRDGGSMTLEAAIVLPLFIFFFLYITGLIEMYHYHGLISFALWDVGNELTVYETAGGAVGIDVPDVLVSYTLIRGTIEEMVGKENLNNSPIKRGIGGISLWESDFDQEKGIIHIVATYEVCPPMNIFPFFYGRLVNEYYGKSFNGYAIDEGAQQTAYVYITTYGTVYHASSSCSSLQVKEKKVPATLLSTYRNNDGKKYTACSYCTGRDTEWVYITEEGERYHTDGGCRALNRTIKRVEKDSVSERRACKKCYR